MLPHLVKTRCFAGTGHGMGADQAGKTLPPPPRVTYPMIRFIQEKLNETNL